MGRNFHAPINEHMHLLKLLLGPTRTPFTVISLDCGSQENSNRMRFENQLPPMAASLPSISKRGMNMKRTPDSSYLHGIPVYLLQNRTNLHRSLFLHHSRQNMTEE